MIAKFLEWGEKIGQFGRFLIAGSLAFAVNIVSLYVLTEFFLIYYIVSTVLAFLISFAVRS